MVLTFEFVAEIQTVYIITNKSGVYYDVQGSFYF